MPALKPPSKEESKLLPEFQALPVHAVYIPATDAEFAQARALLQAQTVLGFDTESKPLFKVGEVDTGPHMVQLASTEAAWILQLHHPQAVQLAADILALQSICKVGFGLQHDKQSLPKRLGSELRNVIDLDQVFKRHGYVAAVGVRGAVALVLNQHFHKSRKQSTSNWSKRELTSAQIHYAANDAYAPAVVYAALADWESRQIKK